MAKNFYGRTLNDLMSWARNAATILSESAGEFQVPPETIAAFVESTDALEVAIDVASKPATRTVVSVAGRNGAAQRVIELGRLIAQSINANPLTTDMQRFRLHLTIRRRPTRRAVPDTAPRPTFVGRIGTSVTVQLYGRTASVEEGGRPATADGAVVFSYVGEGEPPMDLNAWRNVGIFSRPKLDVTFPEHLPAGTKVYVCAYWYNVHGRGPASIPAHTVLAGGGGPVKMRLAA